LTGRPLFQGSTPMEVMTKHASEPVIPPDVIVKDVPKKVSAIVQKMVAKKPDDRYPAMSGVITALEDFLQVQAGSHTQALEEQAATVEKCARVFAAAPGERLRKMVLMGLGGVAALLVVFCVFKLYLFVAVQLILLTAMTTVAYILVSGYSAKSFFYLKLRE